MKYAYIMRKNFINFLGTRAPHDLMNLYHYAWQEDGTFDNAGVVFMTFDNMVYGDLEEFRDFVCDIVGAGYALTDSVYYTYTTSGYKPADVSDLYDEGNIAGLAEWLINNQYYCFPSRLFWDMVDVDSTYTIERYCRIIADHI